MAEFLKDVAMDLNVVGDPQTEYDAVETASPVDANSDELDTAGQVGDVQSSRKPEGHASAVNLATLEK